MLVLSLGKNPRAAVIDAVVKFLLPYEKNCVSLVDRIGRREVGIFCILGSSREILGVFSYSSGGQILHCIPDSVRRYDEYLALLRIYFSTFDLSGLFSVIGDESGTNLILSAIYLATRKLPSSSQSFLLMEHIPGTESAGSGLKIRDGRMRSVCAGTCSINLLDPLMVLQESYEREEVLLDNQRFNPLASKFIMKKAISENNVYAAFFDNRIVAKGAINATGLNCVQLGGVFTVPSFRKNGFAEFLIKRIVAEKRAAGKRVVLFVKPKNIAARTLYKRCGFSDFGTFKISYY